MIRFFLNQQERDDIKIMTGGQLEQLSTHATSSSLSIEIPVKTDDIKECDYVELYDSEQIIFAGIIMEKKQATFNMTPQWKIYDLTLSGNSDLITPLFVDLTFPAGANIKQILYGNNRSDPDFDSDLGSFLGLFGTRIEPEGITINDVDDFSGFILSESAYLWGRSVSDTLDEICSIASAWWEVTPDKRFNMKYKSNRVPAPFTLDNGSKAFNLSVSNDALTYYSACRVNGGTGTSRKVEESSVRGAFVERVHEYVFYQKDAETIVSLTPIHSVVSITQTEAGKPPTDPAMPGTIKVGYKGLHDDDPEYQALMTSGGTEITMKEGYKLVVIIPNSPYYAITVNNAVFDVDVFIRIVDPQLAQEIAAKRGGTGVIEYALEDDSITDLPTAANVAQDFLKSHSRIATEISFSTFSKCEVGQLLTADLPYYSIFGNYEITKIVATTILDRVSGIVFQYNVTASTVDYRDPYKGLWYRPIVTKFTLTGDQAPEDGIFLNNAINVKTFISVYASGVTTWAAIEENATSWELFESLYPSWQLLQSPTSPITWNSLQQIVKSWAEWENKIKSWAWIENIELGWYYLGNYLTNYGKEKLMQFMSGESVNNFADLFGAICLENNLGGRELFEPQDVSKTATGGVSTFFLLPTDATYVIKKILVPENNKKDGEAILSADVDIDHIYGGPRGQYSITIAISTTIE